MTDKEQDLLKYEWHFEGGSDLAGNPLELDKAQSDDVELVFKADNYFLLFDGQKWEGKYTVEKAGSAYKLDLYCDGDDTVFSGVYGMRNYQDGSEVPSITLQTSDKVLSFVAKK